MLSIKIAGNPDRAGGQTKALLLHVSLHIVKNTHPTLAAHLGEITCRGSAIRCIFVGEHGVPFAVLMNYGAAAISRMENAIGNWYAVEYADDTGAAVQPLPLFEAGEGEPAHGEQFNRGSKGGSE